LIAPSSRTSRRNENGCQGGKAREQHTQPATHEILIHHGRSARELCCGGTRDASTVKPGLFVLTGISNEPDNEESVAQPFSAPTAASKALM
jgi:hypothetical protein